jgi:hypothetical protein
MNRSSDIFSQVFRFVLVVILQVLIFQHLEWNLAGRYDLHILIYPVFILMLPLSSPNYLGLLAGFLMGLVIDLFYFSYGVHASAGVFTAYARSVYISFFKPQIRYEGDTISFENVPRRWLYGYVATLLFLHLFWYFLIEFFSFFLLGQVFLHALVSYVPTLFFVALYLMVFQPKG